MELDEAMKRLQETEAALEGALTRVGQLDAMIEGICQLCDDAPSNELAMDIKRFLGVEDSDST